MAAETPSLDTIFCAVVAIASEGDRAAYLAAACGEDHELRARVERLVAAHFRAGSFLEWPAPSPESTGPLAPPAEAPAPAAVPEGPGAVIGPYKLLQQIGEGGMGIVYMAEQHEPVRRRVALKIIKPGMDSAQVSARFEAERQALALMDHPNIARILDAGTTDSARPFFVMELVKGTPITEFCDQNRLTPRERLELFVPVCQAIQHAHQKGIIHRDVKPSNVLIALYDGKPVPKVIDFGIAKATDQRLTEKTLFTRHGQVVGTFEYMSPEQATLDALDVDTRSDVYALGVLLYELLTGTTPLERERLRQAALGEILRLIREEEPPRPSARLSGSGGGLPMIAAYRQTESQKLPKLVRGELDWIAMKALEKDRARRYETASALAADVRRYLSEEPVEARPPSAGYRLRKFVRRNRGPVLACSVVLLALVTGVIGTTWGMVEALTAREEEARQRHAAEGQRNRAMTAEAEAKKNEGKAKEATDEAVRLARKEKAARKLAEANEAKAEWRLYASQIASAERGWETSNPALLYHYLNQCRPDFRGWEHDYLYTLANLNQQTLRGHTAYVRSVAFSPDGKRLASASGDGTVKLWDPRSGQEVLTLKGNSIGAGCVAFSPDGKRLASGSDDGTVKLWDAASGHEVRSFKGHRGGILSVAFSPDGKRLASGSADGTVKLWDTDSGQSIRTLTGHTDQVRGVAFSPNGKRLASASEDKTVKVWDADSGHEILTLKGHMLKPGDLAKQWVRSVAFSPDGKRLASAAGDVKLWELASGQESLTLQGHTGFVYGVAFSPDGKRLATASDDGTVKLWGAASGQVVLTFKGHTGKVISVAFSPDGKRLASASYDQTVKLWDAASRQDVLTLKGHSYYVSSIAFSPDGKRLATASSAYPDGRGPISGPRGGGVKVWDAASGQELLTIKSVGGCVAFSPDGKLLASASGIDTVKVWDAGSGEEVHTLTGDTTWVKAVAFSPDGKLLASVSNGGTVKVWDASSGQKIRTFKGLGHNVLGVAFSSDGKLLASGSRRTGLKLWDLGSGQEVPSFRAHTGPVQTVAFSPDGQLVASAGDGHTVKLWDARSGQEFRTLKGHLNAVVAVAFSPGGKRLASASWDGTVKLWGASSGQEVLTLRGDNIDVSCVAFSPDGKRLASASADTIRIWDATKSMKELPQLNLP